MTLHNAVFQRQIWEYFCNDMSSCFEANKEYQNHNGRFRGGLNYTSALVIFSVIDMVSGYYSGKRTDSDGVADFLSTYLGRYDERFKNKLFSKKFYEVFRHGLSHQWGPKHSGVDMGDSNTLLYIAGGNVTALAIPAFYEAITKTIKDYENDLDRSPELQARFKNRYSEIAKNDTKEMEDLRKMMTGTTI